MRMNRLASLLSFKGPRRSRGSVLILVIITVLILAMLVTGLATLSAQQTRNRIRYETYKDEFAAGEIALNKAYAQLQFMINYGTPNFDTKVASMAAPTVANMTFPTFSVTKTFDGSEAVVSGQWSGLSLARQRYAINVNAVKTGGMADRFSDPGAALSQTVQVTYIPLYMFAIFYDPLMEIAPGAYMQINGRVHANRDAYIQSNAGLDFLQNVTVAGSIYHGRYSASGQSDSDGGVTFTNGSSQLSMLLNGSWLTSLTSNWSGLAMNRWSTHVEDKAMGVSPLNLPIPSVASPHSIIEKPVSGDPLSVQTAKLYNQAGLRIIRASNGTISATNAAGTAVSLTYTDPNHAGVTKSIVSTTTFYDGREGKTVASLDLNLGNMIEGKIYPSNGIVYVSSADQGSNLGAVRLVNGAKLPQSTVTTGFSVASDNPVYVKGDYNTSNKTVAMIAADAINILSNAWNDANSTDYSKRTPTETTVNAVCMQGNVPSANGNYSGGVENSFRFLENWSGVKYNFNGSIVIMWNSTKATGIWGKSNVYAAPTRIWAWDTALGGVTGPPGAPRVVQITKMSWNVGNAS